MDPFHFSCPHCKARLRVRDALSVGRPARCPDCAKWFVLVEEKAELFVRPCPAPAPTPAPEPVAASAPHAGAPPGGAVAPAGAPAVGTKKPAIRSAERKAPTRSGSKPAA